MAGICVTQQEIDQQKTPVSAVLPGLDVFLLAH
jgi:hypothetical protein